MSQLNSDFKFYQSSPKFVACRKMFHADKISYKIVNLAYVWVKVEGGGDQESRPSVVENECIASDEGAVGDTPHVGTLVRQRDRLKDLLVDAEGDPTQVQGVVANLLTLPRVAKDLAVFGGHHQLVTDGHQVGHAPFNHHFESLLDIRQQALFLDTLTIS